MKGFLARDAERLGLSLQQILNDSDYEGSVDKRSQKNRLSMRIPGIKAGKHAGKWLYSRFNRHALILGYHRVADVSNDLFRICVTPDHFQEQIEVLSRYANVIRLNDLIEGIRGGNLPKNCVAITFDDGYRELLSTVKPILESYHITCTVFISTGWIGQEFWWDELERLMRARFSESNHYMWSLYLELLSLSIEDRQRVIRQLREQTANIPCENNKPRAMTLRELVELSSEDLIEFGSHGVNHLPMGQLGVDEQKAELVDSKAFLESHLGKPISCFSYPHGSYSSISLKLLFDSGYRSACRSYQRVVILHNDLYKLPRFWIPNWDGATFKRWLLRWL